MIDLCCLYFCVSKSIIRTEYFVYSKQLNCKWIMGAETAILKQPFNGRLPVNAETCR